MAILNNNPLVGASGNQGSYNINNSLRFRSSASAYLSRTPASNGDRQKWTFSGWVKRGASGVRQGIFVANPSGAVYWGLEFDASNALNIYDSNAGGTTALTTTALYRDFGAWYHVVVAVDTTQATASNRCKIYVNGSQVTSFVTANYPTQNSNTQINTGSLAHYIGNWNPSVSNLPFDGYMADVNFIDGQALTPSSFGETDTVTGVWKAKKYTGTYGTNGFYLKFSDIATTSGSNAGLGKDFSGNSNYWTTNNISVTSGTTYDAMIDSPTNASISDTQPVGNYCTLNPLSSNLATKPQEGNLYFNTDPSNNAFYIGTMGVSSGKWYWEYQVTSQYCSMGVTQLSYSYGYFPTSSGSLAYANYSGTKYNNGTSGGSYMTVANGDKIGIALDLDSGTITMYKNNVSQGVMYSGLSGTFFPLLGGPNGWGAGYVNFGQRPFAYTPPTGHKAICTTNLPNSTIVKGNKYMDATLYTGNGSTQTVTNAGSFKPDFVWIKRRDGAGQDHVLQDSNRGFGGTTKLASSSTAAENTTGGATGSEWGSVTAANSNGFSITASTSGDQVNKNTWTYVGWQWQAGQGSTSSNTSGSITSTVSVNATAGFSVVTYAGTLTSAGVATVGHGLGVAPKMIISKSLGTSQWVVQHTSLTSPSYFLYLNTTDAQDNKAGNGTMSAPTSTVFSTNWTTGLNVSGSNLVAYCWAEIAGFSKFGSYTGNGSADGPFVFTNFRPKYILVKSTGTASWFVIDTARLGYNSANNYLLPNSSGAEATYNGVDILSNGFKVRNTDSGYNDNGVSYIYACFAENPFKNSLAR